MNAKFHEDSWIIVVFPGEKESFPLSFTCILSVISFPLHGLSVVLKADCLNNIRLSETNPPLASKYIKANINTNF